MDASCKKQLRDIALLTALKQKLLSKTALHLHPILDGGHCRMTGMLIRAHKVQG